MDIWWSDTDRTWVIYRPCVGQSYTHSCHITVTNTSYASIISHYPTHRAKRCVWVTTQAYPNHTPYTTTTVTIWQTRSQANHIWTPILPQLRTRTVKWSQHEPELLTNWWPEWQYHWKITGNFNCICNWNFPFGKFQLHMQLKFPVWEISIAYAIEISRLGNFNCICNWNFPNGKFQLHMQLKFPKREISIVYAIEISRDFFTWLWFVIQHDTYRHWFHHKFVASCVQILELWYDIWAWLGQYGANFVITSCDCWQ